MPPAVATSPGPRLFRLAGAPPARLALLPSGWRLSRPAGAPLAWRAHLSRLVRASLVWLALFRRARARCVGLVPPGAATSPGPRLSCLSGASPTGLVLLSPGWRILRPVRASLARL